MSIDKSLEDKRSEILRIAASHGAQTVRVFGSRSRGQARSDSDLDLLITLEDGRSLLDIVAIKQDLEDLLGHKVDVVTEASISPYIRDSILEKAIRL
jgi:predicted nucleotidyltransferase